MTVAALPRRFEDLDLSQELVASLLLRTLAAAGRLSGGALEERLGVRYEALDSIIEGFRQQHLLDLSGYAEGMDHRALPIRTIHVISDQGRRRAADLAAVTTRYLGPCPISFRDYVALLHGQCDQQQGVVAESVLRVALGELELQAHVIEQIGSAMASRSSLFIFGPPGNGKSTIARRIAPLLGDPILVPWAVAVGDEVIRLLDPLYHRPPAGPPALDRRLVRVNRPVVRAGGELRYSQLELTHDPVNRHYEAPLQWKANGGVLVIDDFGRQSEPPNRLLNRFIVPMEESIDYLDLAASGHKIDVPFLTQVIFSTNLSPADLVDEAFLRRIAYKVEVPDPPVDAYARILQRECERAGIGFDSQVVPWLLSLYGSRPLRGSHPKQLIARLIDRARFRGRPPTLSPQTVREAFETTFIVEARAPMELGLHAGSDGAPSAVEEISSVRRAGRGSVHQGYG